MALTAQEQQNVAIVQGFFQSFLDNTLFDFIDNNFQADIQPRIVTTTRGINNPSDYSDSKFEHELQGIDPLTGLKEGIPEFKNFFIDISTEYNVLDFQIGKFVADENSVVVVGTLNYENIETGNTTGVLPYFIDFTLEDGKISEYATYDDTFSFGATARQEGRWRRFWDGEWTNISFGTTEAETLSGAQTEKNVIYGYQENDILNGGENDDVLWGGSGDDSLDGKGGEDTLYGNTGNNTLTGGLGNDIFAIGLDQGSNTITDFTKGEDLIGLTGTLTFDDLNITSNGSNTVISKQDSGETLANLTGIAANTLEESDFYLIPNEERKTAENVAIVQGFFDSFITGTYEDYIDENFDPEVKYIVVQNESPLFGPERESTLTHTGLYEGQDGAKYFFDETATERDVVSFDIHQVVGSGDSVLAFGSFRYRAPLSRGGSGDLGETEWASKIEMLDGKIISYTFMEDSYQVAAFYRRKDEGVQQRREVNGETRDILTGTNADDTISPLDTENVNFVFGYGGDDTITGGNQGDRIYGGIGNNTLTGGNGADFFVIGEGAAGTVRHRHNGPDSDDFTLDTITDFQKGEDKLGLANGLTFAELTFTTNGNDLEISITSTGENIAVLQGAGNIVIEADDVETLPAATGTIQVAEVGPGLPDGYFVKEDPFGATPTNPSLDEDANVQLVKTFFDNFFQGGAAAKTFVADNFATNVEFTVGGSESDLFGAERQAVLPYTGLYEGINGVESFFDIIDSEREIVDYKVDNVFSQGDTVGAYGTYEYRSIDTGELLASEWSARLRIVEENGQPLIERSYFFEDTAAVVHGYRLKEAGTPLLEWTREFAGRDQTFIAATDAAETIEGKDVISKESSGTQPAQPLSNRIFAYGGNDTVIGKTGNDFLFGGTGDDTLNGGDGSDDLFGNEGNDDLDGGLGDDNLYGNQGNDNLTGGAGKDIFVIGKGEGSDIINDYVDGEDTIGLLGVLQFEDLNIAQSGTDTVISLNSDGEILATLTGVTASDLTSDDFTKRSDSGAEINPRRDLLGFPEFNFDENYPIVDHPLFELAPTPDEQNNLEVAQGFFTSFQNGSDTLFDYIDQNFAKDIRYTVITPTDGINNPSDYSDNSFTHERQAVIPLTGLKVGKEEVKDLFDDLFSEFDVLDFQTDKLVIDENNVLAFGNFSYINKETGNQTESLSFISDITLEDGKITEVQEYYDTYSLAATTRQGGEWRRFWDGEWTNYLFGTTEVETLEGNETEKNVIYGYQNNDFLYGGNNDDVIWGGSGSDRINGKQGADTLYGNEGSDTFVLNPGNGTDTIGDFVIGEDQIELTGSLNFADLTITNNNGNAEISVTTTGETLAIVQNIDANDISGSDIFFSSYSAEEQAHIDLIQRFFSAQNDGTILSNAADFFADDGRYIFIRGGEERIGRGDADGPESILSSTPTAFSDSKGGLPLQGLDFITSSFADFPNNLNFNPVKVVPQVGGFTTEANQLDTNAYNDLSVAHERNDMIPFSNNYVGSDGVEAFYQDFFNNFEIVSFITDEKETTSPYPYGIIANDNDLAVYGEFEFLNKFTGNTARAPFRIDIEFEEGVEGKIKTYHFWTDTHTLAAAMREGGSWRGQYGLEVPTVTFGPNPEDFRFLTVSELEATGLYEDTIFGRQYNPTGYLIQPDGTPVNDNPFQQDQVNERLFLPVYIQWGTGNNDDLSGFTDTTKYFDPNLPNDQLYGLQGNDTLAGLAGDDELYGGSGDDSLSGGSGNDSLYGHTGLNTLEGGSGEDTFVLDNLFQSDDPITTSTIVDFAIGEDKIGLAGDGQGNQLQFEDLDITDGANGAEIRLQNSAGEPPLAIVENTTANQLTADQFVELSPDYTISQTTPDNVIGDAEENKSLILGFFQSFFTGDVFTYMRDNFTEDARYVVIQGENNDYTADDAFSGERYRITPTTKEWTGIDGSQGFIFSLFQSMDVLGTRWPDIPPITNFYIEKIVLDSSDPDNIALFGRFLYRNNSTGILTDGPFAYNFQIKHVDDGQGGTVPKVDIVSFFEDYIAFGYTSHQGGTWTRNYNGELTDIIWGTTASETLDGTAIDNIIYGYQSNDMLDGKAGNDEIYGGYGDDTIKGGIGDDQLWGDGVDTGTPGNDNPANNPGKDIFVLSSGEGTDTIHDFEVGQDQISLLDNLSFNQLTLTAVDGDLEVKITDTEEVLAILKGVDQLNSSDVIVEPEDLVFGTPDGDTLFAPLDLDGKSDIVFTGAGDDEVDIVLGGDLAGNNRIFTGSGVDTISVANRDRAFGGSGDDELDATDASLYRISGGDGNDTFFLGTDGRALGGDGDDSFFVQEGGGNIIAGGAGADAFWIINGELPTAGNTILDFEAGTDVLGIGGAGVGFDDLTLTGDTIMIGATTIAYLNGVDATSLTADNFAFI